MKSKESNWYWFPLFACISLGLMVAVAVTSASGTEQPLCELLDTKEEIEACEASLEKQRSI